MKLSAMIKKKKSKAFESTWLEHLIQSEKWRTVRLEEGPCKSCELESGVRVRGLGFPVRGPLYLQRSGDKGEHNAFGMAKK